MEEIVILGTGIAGCTAAIYTARAGLSPLIISGMEDGGQLTLTTTVENFPGFPAGILGPELMEKCKKQAERFGAQIQTDAATAFKKIKQGFELTLMSGKKIQTKTLVIATGASARWLGLPSEEKYKGRGVTVCAACDGALFKGKEVVVIGGGDSAMEEAIFLTKFATKVTIIHRRDTLRASRIMQERAKKNSKINFIFNTEVKEILGDGKVVKGVKLTNTKTGKDREVSCAGVFLAIGHVPNTNIFVGKLALDKKGYIKADQFTHTSLPGVFAAGDVQDFRYRQAIVAAGSGCMAAMEAEKYLAGKE